MRLHNNVIIMIAHSYYIQVKKVSEKFKGDHRLEYKTG